MKKIVLFSVLVLSLLRCAPPADTASRGEITIAADESFKPVLDQLTHAYHGVYPNAIFNMVYKPEQESILLLLGQKARMIVTSRKLNAQENTILKQQKGAVKEIDIATDGLALIQSKANSDSMITIKQLQGLFDGSIKTWAELGGGNQKEAVTLVFDNDNSSNITYALDKFKVNDPSKIRIFTTKSNVEVINFVKKNPSAIGFIGVNWISDGDLAISAELSKGLRVMGVADSNKVYYQPFQRDLGLKNYPLRRQVYMISREGYSGLATGMINYVMRDVGSLVIEKCGLWPRVVYDREVNIKKVKI